MSLYGQALIETIMSRRHEYLKGAHLPSTLHLMPSEILALRRHMDETGSYVADMSMSGYSIAGIKVVETTKPVDGRFLFESAS